MPPVLCRLVIVRQGVKRESREKEKPSVVETIERRSVERADDDDGEEKVTDNVVECGAHGEDSEGIEGKGEKEAEGKKASRDRRRKHRHTGRREKTRGQCNRQSTR